MKKLINFLWSDTFIICAYVIIFAMCVFFYDFSTGF